MANPIFPGSNSSMPNNTNPMMVLMQIMKNGRNMTPEMMLQIMAEQNPQFAQIMKNVNVNDSKGIEQMCKNICQQKNLDYDTMLAKFRNMR